MATSTMHKFSPHSVYMAIQYKHHFRDVHAVREGGREGGRDGGRGGGGGSERENLREHNSNIHVHLYENLSKDDVLHETVTINIVTYFNGVFSIHYCCDIHLMVDTKTLANT